eukprot:TRINITY_DN4122_c0_g1_i3.p1 TRINITY_DN4122_c0_g1~~TRINITY_DN4122_c0_g1_i3.p1  ORF type:complete len:156 (+),score=64.88 TRINITY_DN4122_c0_g1_i3:141-608(+)
MCIRDRSCPITCAPIFSLTKAQCIGVLGIQAGLQAFKMTLFRLAGSPGEQDPNSDLNRHYLAQQLTAEWNPIGMVLILAGRTLMSHKDNEGCKTKNCIFSAAANAFVVGRLAFTAVVLFAPQHHMKVAPAAMIATYLSTFTMAGLLLAQCKTQKC